METHLFKWVDEVVIDEIEKVDAKHDELVNNVQDLRQSMMEHFKEQVIYNHPAAHDPNRNKSYIDRTEDPDSIET
ncbi:hypothetical protein DY000_02053729 [Brassica cretica]|uniref:Uncharacterized protein n=1 Tax=Brassica cretica TaxID=69181 RepID=A0ABQ7A5I8_BRACR|nr:hypothetical protein DY000_02053729 [Brassica cretica]